MIFVCVFVRILLKPTKQQNNKNRKENKNDKRAFLFFPSVLSLWFFIWHWLFALRVILNYIRFLGWVCVLCLFVYLCVCLFACAMIITVTINVYTYIDIYFNLMVPRPNSIFRTVGYLCYLYAVLCCNNEWLFISMPIFVALSHILWL